MAEILIALSLEEGDQIRGAQLFPIGEWSHPQGKLKVDYARAQRFAAGFKKQLAGQKLPIFYIHSSQSNVSNPLYGKAAGWMTDVRADPKQGVLIDIDFTKAGAEAVRDHSYQYLSAEFFDQVRLPHHDESHKDVLVGAALVNKPHLKGMRTVLSEDTGSLFIEEATSKPDDPEGGGPVDPILFALAKSAGLKLSEDATELGAKDRASIEEYLQGESGKITDLEAKLDLVQTKLDGSEDDNTKQARNLAEAGFKDEAKLLSEYRGEKLAKKLAKELPKGSEFTPAVEEKLMAFATDNDPTRLQEALAIVASGKGVVDLSEHGSSGSGSEGDTPAGSVDNASTKLIALAEAVVKDNSEINFSDAMDQVAGENPNLWDEHQKSMGSEVTG